MVEYNGTEERCAAHSTSAEPLWSVGDHWTTIVDVARSRSLVRVPYRDSRLISMPYGLG